MSSLRYLLVLLSIVSLPACSPRDFLTRRLAADLIAASPAFNARQQFFLHTGVLSNKEYIAPEYLVLQHKGWIQGTTVNCPPNIQPAPCWDVVLTPLGVDTFRNLIPERDSNKQFFSIPTAKRDVVEIRGISKAGNFADVQFTWRWTPLNEVGAALDGGVVYSAIVAFRHYDDGWRVLEGNAMRTDQSLDDALKNSEPVR